MKKTKIILLVALLLVGASLACVISPEVFSQIGIEPTVDEVTTTVNTIILEEGDLVIQLKD